MSFPWRDSVSTGYETQDGKRDRAYGPFNWSRVIVDELQFNEDGFDCWTFHLSRVIDRLRVHPRGEAVAWILTGQSTKELYERALTQSVVRKELQKNRMRKRVKEAWSQIQGVEEIQPMTFVTGSTGASTTSSSPSSSSGSSSSTSSGSSSSSSSTVATTKKETDTVTLHATGSVPTMSDFKKTPAGPAPAQAPEPRVYIYDDNLPYLNASIDVEYESECRSSLLVLHSVITRKKAAKGYGLLESMQGLLSKLDVNGVLVKIKEFYEGSSDAALNRAIQGLYTAAIVNGEYSTFSNLARRLWSARARLSVVPPSDQDKRVWLLEKLRSARPRLPWLALVEGVQAIPELRHTTYKMLDDACWRYDEHRRTHRNDTKTNFNKTDQGENKCFQWTREKKCDYGGNCRFLHDDPARHLPSGNPGKPQGNNKKNHRKKNKQKAKPCPNCKGPDRNKHLSYFFPHVCKYWKCKGQPVHNRIDCERAPKYDPKRAKAGNPVASLNAALQIPTGAPVNESASPVSPATSLDTATETDVVTFSEIGNLLPNGELMPGGMFTTEDMASIDDLYRSYFCAAPMLDIEACPSSPSSTPMATSDHESEPSSEESDTSLMTRPFHSVAASTEDARWGRRRMVITQRPTLLVTSSQPSPPSDY